MNQAQQKKTKRKRGDKRKGKKKKKIESSPWFTRHEI